MKVCVFQSVPSLAFTARFFTQKKKYKSKTLNWNWMYWDWNSLDPSMSTQFCYYSTTTNVTFSRSVRSPWNFIISLASQTWSNPYFSLQTGSRANQSFPSSPKTCLFESYIFFKKEKESVFVPLSLVDFLFPQSLDLFFSCGVFRTVEEKSLFWN